MRRAGGGRGNGDGRAGFVRHDRQTRRDAGDGAEEIGNDDGIAGFVAEGDGVYCKVAGGGAGEFVAIAERHAVGAPLIRERRPARGGDTEGDDRSLRLVQLGGGLIFDGGRNGESENDHRTGDRAVEEGRADDHPVITVVGRVHRFDGESVAGRAGENRVINYICAVELPLVAQGVGVAAVGGGGDGEGGGQAEQAGLVGGLRRDDGSLIGMDFERMGATLISAGGGRSRARRLRGVEGREGDAWNAGNHALGRTAVRDGQSQHCESCEVVGDIWEARKTRGGWGASDDHWGANGGSNCGAAVGGKV